jgi:hypothetical protein
LRAGELIGGSVREENLDTLQARMKSMNMNVDDYQWYLDLRRYPPLLFFQHAPRPVNVQPDTVMGVHSRTALAPYRTQALAWASSDFCSS